MSGSPERGHAAIFTNLRRQVKYYDKFLSIGYADAGWEAVLCLPVTLPDKTGHAIPECKKF